MSIKKFCRNVSQLSTVKRFSQATLCAPESVLEHSGAVALLALYIGEGLKAEGFEIDFEALLKKAILHDFDEIATGDVARPVKYYSQSMRQNFRDMEKSNMEKITKDFSPDNYKPFMDIWENSKFDLEGGIIAYSDFICVVYKLHDEICGRNNYTMFTYFQDEYFVNNQKYADALFFFNKEFHSSEFLTRTKSEIVSMLRDIKLIKNSTGFDYGY